MFITQPQDRAWECGLMSADGKFPNHFQNWTNSRLAESTFNLNWEYVAVAFSEALDSESGILGAEKTLLI